MLEATKLRNVRNFISTQFIYLYVKQNCKHEGYSLYHRVFSLFKRSEKENYVLRCVKFKWACKIVFFYLQLKFLNAISFI